MRINTETGWPLPAGSEGPVPPVGAGPSSSPPTASRHADSATPRPEAGAVRRRARPPRRPRRKQCLQAGTGGSARGTAVPFPALAPGRKDGYVRCTERPFAIRTGELMARHLSLADAVAELVHDGDTVALEGFTHLIPFAAGHEIIRQGRRDLTLVRMTPDIVYDQLIGAGCAAQAGLLLGRQPRRRLAAPLPRRGRERLAGAAGDRGAQPRRAWPTATSPAPPGCRSPCCAATAAPTCPTHTDTITHRSPARSPARS